MKERIITKEGLNDLKQELKNLIKIERPKVIQEIAEARAQGDLSENAEFDAAREKQGQIEDRIRELDDIIQNASIIKSKSSKGKKVSIGTTVKFQDLAENSVHEVTIVGRLEADPFINKISNESPLGKALEGLSENDTTIVLSDKKYEIKVLEILK